MKVKAVAPFLDIKANADRKVGEVFECSEARFKEINATEYGVLVEAVEEKPARKTTARKAAKPKAEKE